MITKHYIWCLFVYLSVCLFLCVCQLTTARAATSVDYQKAHLDQCGGYYVDRLSPLLGTNYPTELYYLCLNGFALGYASTSKTALWSAERLTDKTVEEASRLDRVDNFHEESQLPPRIKAFLADYQHVAYDRGHLAPNGDMNTLAAQYDSFSLANIIPQHPKNNRGIWKNIESRTRYLAIKHQNIYVITGGVFLGSQIKKINGNIFVPSHLYKAIYIPSLKQAAVYFVPNDDSQRVEVISLAELDRRTGIKVMPSLATNIQQHAMRLPMTDQEIISGSSDKPPVTLRLSVQNILSASWVLVLAVYDWLIDLFHY